MDLNKLKERLKEYKRENIIVTKHAELQAFSINIELEEVKENITNPEKLVYAKAQEVVIG